MKRSRTRCGKSEEGIALIISIFVLMLISVVAIALIVSSGTESALAGNYRSSTGVYYAAMAGLEEARGRLLRSNPDYVVKADANFLLSPGMPPGTPLNVGDVRYILNPNAAQGENMGNVLALYPDNEYATEFPAGQNSRRVIASTSPNNGQGLPGPLYKWVRINAVSEQWLRQGLGQDVAPFDGSIDTTPLFYDGTNLTDVPAFSGSQVFEITAMAILPNGSQKILQYLVAPVPIALPPFFAALTLSGSNGADPTFHAPFNNNAYAVKGDDYNCNGNLVGSKAAIGVYGNYPGNSSNSAVNGIISGIPPSPPSIRSNYTGQGGAPDVEPFQTSQTPGELNNIVQTIIQSADAVVPAGSAATQTSYLDSLNMSPSNMLTVVANGDLDLTHWGRTGYGLLLVTGTYTMDPDNGWYGIILVIGEGKINNVDNTGSREFDGAVFVAKTNGGGSDLGAASVQFDNNMPGTGIRYSTCWIQKAHPPGSYKILSFHEIAQ